MRNATVSKGNTAGTTAVAILSRILAKGGRFAPSLARHLLTLEFTEADRERMHELASRNQEGLLSAAELDELHAFADAGCLLGILHSKARKSLAQREPRRA